jgi:GNAT superfamily N-acetyltransferase
MTTHTIIYKKNTEFRLEDIKLIYNDSTLAQRRPVHDNHRLILMMEHANLIITAWDNDTPIGICRCMSDFSYVTYIADLAIIKKYQCQGIGKKMIQTVQEESGRHTKLVLLSAPDANNYYPHIGFKPHPRAWIIAP